MAIEKESNCGDDIVRVAHIIGKMMSGGVESVVMNYFRHIDRTKIQFDFIIDDDSSIVPYEEIAKLGGRVFTIPPYQKPVAYHKALLALLKKNKYRIVHSHINTLSVFPLFAAKRAGVPVRIAHSHSTAGKGEFAKNIMKYALRPFSRVFPTNFCACSEWAGRWLFGDKLYNSGKVILVRNAIDISKFIFNTQIRESVKKELGIEDKFVIGHVGRFMKQKNHSFLIDIFDSLHKRQVESVLLLVGEGELEGEIRDKVENLGLADSVRFLGVRNDVHRLLQAMDIFLLPSLYEGLPVIGIEVQVSGLKIIAADTITREAKITDDFKYMSLDNTAEEWAEEILAKKRKCNRERSDVEAIRVAGFEIDTAAEILMEFYDVCSESV